jgi:ribonucleoside-diphosphate reductase alpha subunit
MSSTASPLAPLDASGGTTMRVRKRDGRLEEVEFDKVSERVRKAAAGLHVNATAIAQRILGQIVDGVKTSELDELTASLAASNVTAHPDYGTLAARIATSNLHKSTPASFAAAVERLAAATNQRGEPSPIVSAALLRAVRDPVTGPAIEARIDYERDFLLDYFGLKTLEKAYLLRDADRAIVERPAHMWMRVALGMWLGAAAGEPDDLDKAFEAYDLMSRKFYTHATPTLFNSGTPRPQLSSCFLLAMRDDSIEGIFQTLEQCAVISKGSGGIGLHLSNIRAKGALIAGTNGRSNGLVPMLRVFNNAARYVDQGGGKRNGSFAVYIEPWHADVEDFLRLKLNTGAEEDRARDLFYALWVPDLFMERVMAKGDWTLFCPSEAPGLADVVGDDFKALYERYEAEGRGRKTLPAQKLFFQILEAQIETGTPYLCYKDAANRKSNQQHLGVIKSSNLCSEIIEYSDANETAVCNLASLALPAFVRPADDALAEPADPASRYDFEALRAVVRVAIRNLDRVITINHYPTPETRRSNLRHRPVGLGVQGLADVFAMLGLAWDSPAAAALNKRIFAHIYHAAVSESAALAAAQGAHESFPGSPASQGRLQFDLWGVDPAAAEPGLDWAALRAAAAAGLRNSLLVAPMPTASTSQVLGWTEAIEPGTSVIFTRRTLAGEFIVINKHLVRAMLDRGLWTPDVKDRIVANGGSVQGLPEVPADLQSVFRTAWELSQRTLINLAADRGAFVCQSQSLNLFVRDPDFAKLSSMHVHAWRSGLKTGVYYVRTKSSVQAQQFTVPVAVEQELAKARAATAAKAAAGAAAAAEEGGAPPDCLVCSS